MGLISFGSFFLAALVVLLGLGVVEAIGLLRKAIHPVAPPPNPNLDVLIQAVAVLDGTMARLSDEVGRLAGRNPSWEYMTNYQLKEYYATREQLYQCYLGAAEERRRLGLRIADCQSVKPVPDLEI